MDEFKGKDYEEFLRKALIKCMTWPLQYKCTYHGRGKEGNKFNLSEVGSLMTADLISFASKKFKKGEPEVLGKLVFYCQRPCDRDPIKGENNEFRLRTLSYQNIFKSKLN